jgi:hypothetical protein
MAKGQTEVSQKKRRSNIILALILGTVALIGLAWPLVVMVN